MAGAGVGEGEVFSDVIGGRRPSKPLAWLRPSPINESSKPEGWFNSIQLLFIETIQLTRYAQLAL